MSGPFDIHCWNDLALAKLDGEHRVEVAAPHLTGRFAVVIFANDAEQVAFHFPWDDPDADKDRSPTHLSTPTDLAEPDTLSNDATVSHSAERKISPFGPEMLSRDCRDYIAIALLLEFHQ